MKKDQALNKFTKGLQLDMNPMSITSDTLVDCLNGTLITYNGNEYVLQNDMGNARVETATLPPGYIPLGSTSFGGIIYIVSHNPLENKYQIGSFPSPERNLSKDELGNNGNNENTTVTIGFNYERLWKDYQDEECPEISSSLNQIILCDKELHSSDKFKVFSNNIAGLLKDNIISGYQEGNTNVNLYPKYLRIDLISILSNGSVIKLTDNLTWTNFETKITTEEGTETVSGNYYIYPGEIKLNNDNSSSLEEYRNLVQSQYDVYTEKYPGQLGLLCSYEAPSSFNVGYDAIITKDTGTNVSTAQFYYYLNWTNENTGIHKNRVNPYQIQIKQVHSDATTNNTDINLITDIKLPINETTWESSDTQNNKDYFSTKLPDDFYKDDYNVKNYLENWNSGKYISDKLRKNDGSDPQIIVKGPAIEYKIDSKGKLTNVECNGNALSIDDNKFLNLQVTPIMPYGKLNYLTQDLKINLAQLGTGTIDLVLYKYFIDDLKATVDFQFETYLELNKRIKSIDLNVYKLPEDPQETSGTTHTSEKSAGWENVYKKSIIQQSYNTLTQHKIYFNDSFEKDNIYQLEIVVHYADNDDRYYYRILHTTNIFNKKYFDTIDFSELWLCPKKDGTDDTTYGIDPELKITPTLTGSLTTNSTDLEDFDMFKPEAVDQLKSLTYEAKINGSEPMNISISSKYDNIPLTVDESITSAIVNISYTSNYSNVGNNSIDVTTTSTANSISFGNNFPQLNYNINLKGWVNYANIQSVYPYSLTMVDVPYTTPIKINLWAEHENHGNLKLYINDNIEYQFNISDDKHEDIDADVLLRVLRKYCDTNKLDVVTVRIGIEKFNDNDCTTIIYGNNVKSGNPQYYIFGKILPQNPENIFTNYLFVRSGNTGMLLGTCEKNIESSNKNKQNGYFGSLVGDETISNTYQDGFIYNSDHCFKKYVKQLEPVNIYTIKETDIPENPTINFDIEFTVSDKNNLCHFTKYKPTSDPIRNLSFEEGSYIKGFDKHEISISINNKSLLNSLLYEKIHYLAPDRQPINDITRVETTGIYDLDNQIFSGKIDSSGLLLINKPNYNYTNKNTQFHLQFNWEHADHENDQGQQGIKIKGFDVYKI